MANRDRYQLAPIVETITPTPRTDAQGELFARLALRPLPLMKEGPEDAPVNFVPVARIH